MIHVELASQLQAIPIALWFQLREQPLPGVDSQPRAHNRFWINGFYRASSLGFALHPVIRAIIGNLSDFVCPVFELAISRLRVFGGETFAIIEHPINYGSSLRQVFVTAYLRQRFAVGYAPAYLVRGSSRIIALPASSPFLLRHISFSS
jgi:hypothetical protein